jgi:hypothetical protein
VTLVTHYTYFRLRFFVAFGLEVSLNLILIPLRQCRIETNGKKRGSFLLQAWRCNPGVGQGGIIRSQHLIEMVDHWTGSEHLIDFCEEGDGEIGSFNATVGCPGLVANNQRQQ